MRQLIFLTSLSLLAACSEAPIEDQGEAAIAEIEKQIEGDARSLEEAADEAVKVLESEIEEELTADGFSPALPATQRVTENPE